MLAPQQALFRANCWCPLERVQEVEGALQNLVRARSGMGGYEFHETKPPAGVNPPTGFRTNEVTHLFQEIVNTYGVPRYREINPGLFTIATFPFLFGVMFGDIAHGGLLFICGIYLCFWKSKIEKDKESIWNMALSARYLLLLQGLMAFYCGWIYNDFTSIPLKIMNSCYDREHPNLQGALDKTGDCTYSIGFDPNWFHTANELTFMNSFKMKLSIILGVTQMIFGILLRGLNNIFSRKWLDFFFEFLPMLVFMSLTFGYMTFLIILKWTIPWSHTGGEYPINKAPSIISIFIKMVLEPGQWKPENGYALYGDKEGGFQATLQFVFVLVAGLCALLILVPKPLILYCQQKNHKKHATHHHDESMEANLLEHSHAEDNQRLVENSTPGERKVTQAGNDEGEEHHDMGEIIVHQVIETIEFILGSVSNTASYLRLWALSLAHSQLAKVFFEKTLGGSVLSGNPLGAFVGYWIFANITLGVLMLMDQMECFLHALRLHWVEFQSKFYKADGYLFVPYSFERSLKEAIASE